MAGAIMWKQFLQVVRQSPNSRGFGTSQVEEGALLGSPHPVVEGLRVHFSPSLLWMTDAGHKEFFYAHHQSAGEKRTKSH